MNFIQINKNKIGIIIRFLIIFIPFILSFFFLFSPSEKIELTREIINENETVIKISSEEMFKPTFRNALRDLLQVPFNLK